MRHIVETSKQQPSNNSHRLVLASFNFHGRGTKIQKNLSGFFRSVLHQLLSQIPNLLDELSEIYKNRITWEACFTWSERLLRDFMKQRLLTATESCSIRIYVDALDEVGEEAATELIEFFS